MTVEEWPRRRPQSWGCRRGTGSQLGWSGRSCGEGDRRDDRRGVGRAALARLSGRASEAAAFAPGCRGRRGWSMRRGRRGSGSRVSCLGGRGCVVAAPGKIPRAPQDRVKTDRRDAERLARLLMAGELHAVRVPATDEEALRDLVRAREDLRGDLMRMRHRVGKLLLRHDVRWAGNNWTQAHRQWLAAVALPEPVAQDRPRRQSRRDRRTTRPPRRLERRTARSLARPGRRSRAVALSARHRHALGTRAVRRDRRLRSLPPARSADELLGIVPSEHSSGDKRRLGSITKSGSQHARRLLVEAAWHYRSRPGSARARAPPGRADPAGRPRSWQAQRRLHRAGSASTSAASVAPSSRSQSAASWPASAGRSPPPTDPANTHVGRGGGGRRAPSRQRIRDATTGTPPRGGHARC